MRRRDFIKGIFGSAAGWPIAVHAQHRGTPIVGFLNAESAQGYARPLAAFLKGLGETGYEDGRNVTIAGRTATMIGCPRWRLIWSVAKWP